MKVLELTRERLTDGELPATFKGDAPSPFPAINSAPSIEGVSHSFDFPGREFLVEIRETAKATLAQPVRLFQYGLALRRTRSLSMAFAAAQLALGQRMYAAGIDDGQLGAQIDRLDKEIHRAVAGGVPTRAQEVLSKNLFRLLAERALEEDAPLPGADAEYAVARELQSLLARQNIALSAIGASLIPKGQIGWRRVAIGFGTIGFFSFLAIAKMCG
jgi:hypothetical protein